MGLFDEVEYVARKAMFQYYLENNLFRDAAQILANVNMNSNSFIINDVEKANIFIKCAECSLQDNESIDAEVFLNKAGPFMNDISDRQLHLRFRAISAQVLDSNRKFLEAAGRYYDLAATEDAGIDPTDLLELFGKAITCTLLAKTGAQRTRLLNLLYSDNRLQSLEQISVFSSYPSILKKMCLNHLITREELMIFSETLQPHQAAVCL